MNKSGLYNEQITDKRSWYYVGSTLVPDTGVHIKKFVVPVPDYVSATNL